MSPRDGTPDWPRLLDNFSRCRIVVVGDLVADHYVYGQTDRVSREAPVLIVRHERDEVKLGAAGNVAANARALGASVAAVGVVGDDVAGAQLRRAFGDADIALTDVRGDGLETQSKMRVLAGALNTTRQQMLRIDRGYRAPLPAPLRKALAERVSIAAQRADAILVSDYGAGVVCEEVEAVLREAARLGKIVCVDSRYALRRFSGLPFLKPNESELAALTGMSVEDEALSLAAGVNALQQTQGSTLLVTRGHEGMALFAPGQPPKLFPVHGAPEAVDVTGAGDTVLATFGLGLAAGADAARAAQLANVAGGLVVQKPGTASVAPEELRRAVEALA
ncbi:MAG: bifunctional heptose 7-phosphate kinase/heptose 1-phosphate adenyltransferase [Myxococcaceae bacterium]